MYAVIPARGGSKGVVGKNIKELNGKPLIHYTIEAAREIFCDNRIIVSTDSPQIKEVVEETGLKVPFLRPSELATDTAGTYEVLLHANEYMKGIGDNSKQMVLLQPTSPFRTSKHIKEAIELYNQELEMLVSVKETASNPYYLLKEEDGEGFLVNSKDGNYITRQSCPKVWELNGAIYIINLRALEKMKLNQFTKVKKYVMDEISSHDIDSVLDWKVAEAIINLY